jgi:hypothetical protein
MLIRKDIIPNLFSADIQGSSSEFTALNSAFILLKSNEIPFLHLNIGVYLVLWWPTVTKGGLS